MFCIKKRINCFAHPSCKRTHYALIKCGKSNPENCETALSHSFCNTAVVLFFEPYYFLKYMLISILHNLRKKRYNSSRWGGSPPF